MFISLIMEILRKLFCVVFFNSLLVEISGLLINIFGILWLLKQQKISPYSIDQNCCQADSK